MSKGELIKKEIIGHPYYYFNAQGKSLDARLEDIRLTDED